jgi:BASS family bile acid:Na+ symporter
VRRLENISLTLGLVGLFAVAIGLAARNADMWQPATVVATIGLAIGLGALAPLRSYRFTAWIVTGVVLAMIHPERFLHLGSIDLRNKTLILVLMQLVMFGMGTQMKLRDLAGVLAMPYPVVVGITLQFTIMPLVGYSLATGLGFPPPIAAGIVLIGSCSSGLASNVMTFIAKANLPLSITLTSCATLLAPLMTPMWMKLLAEQMVPVDAVAMMMEIIKLIIVPIGAAMLADYLDHASQRNRQSIFALAAMALASLSTAALFGPRVMTIQGEGVYKLMLIVGYLAGAIVVGVVFHELKQWLPQIPRVMPILSMLGIIYVTSVTVAAGRDQLLVIGPLLLVAVVAHNSAGYLLGYWLSRALRLDEKTARTVAFEVGLQNGGMATAIAASLNQLATMGLAAAVFNPWMNFSGSVLANYWRRRSTETVADSAVVQFDASEKRST